MTPRAAPQEQAPAPQEGAVPSSGETEALIQALEDRLGVFGTTIPRRLTPRECERLQGWPDDWTRWGRTPDGVVKELSDSARYRMAGNGVSRPVAEWIGNRISTSRAPDTTRGEE